MESQCNYLEATCNVELVNNQPKAGLLNRIMNWLLTHPIEGSEDMSKKK